jgi:hypothetical protein
MVRDIATYRIEDRITDGVKLETLIVLKIEIQTGLRKQKLGCSYRTAGKERTCKISQVKGQLRSTEINSGRRIKD